MALILQFLHSTFNEKSATRTTLNLFQLLINVFLYMCVLSLINECSAQLSGVNYTVLGDLNLGGIIPLHRYDDKTTQSCGSIRTINALKKVEAMVYTIQQVNQNSTLLPNITLGFEIHDTCSYNAVTLGECLNFIPSARQSDSCCEYESDNTTCPADKPPIIGVVGAQRSSSSVQAAILLGLYHIPQVSYLSTSDELSNNLRYPYFLRTVGPDSYQVSAMIDILLHYDWTYVSFVNSDDTYGKSAQQRFNSLAADNDICIGITRTISLFADDDSYDEVIEELLDIQRGNSHAAVVILFVQLEMAQNILSAAARMDAQRRFIWIGSDGWGNYGEDAIVGNEEVALGAFTVVPSSGTLPKFNEYFRSLTPATSDNPWLPEFLQHYTNCSFTDFSPTRPDCNTPGLIAQLDSDESSHETLVIDSVLTFAYALDSMFRDLCPNESKELCTPIETNGTELLLEYLLGTSFISPANGNVSFLPNGDTSGRYSIKNLQKFGNNNYTFVTVGKWDDTETSETVIKQDVPWYLYDEHPRENITGVPKSICSDPCGMKERRNVNPDNPCCWTCTECNDHEIVANNGTECFSCLNEENNIYGWPNGNFTYCVPIDPRFRVKENAWAIAIISFATFGIAVTLAIIGLYVHNQETPLIKASSRELSYIIFAGIMLSYVTALLFGVSPSTGVCVMRRLGQPIATSLIYVSMATKTVRLFRIFKASMKTARRPKFISSTFQVAVTLTITGIPILWTVIWMIIEPPLVDIQMPYENSRKLQLTCVLSDAETIGIMAWNIVIVFICCIFAFLTRKLPENYNETRFIAFCAFCTFIVFMTFSPIYFTAREAYYQAGYASLGLMVNATVTLVCLYIVKLYAIYFVDLEEMNIFTQTRMRANTGRLSQHGGTVGHIDINHRDGALGGTANPGYTHETESSDPARHSSSRGSSGVPSSPPNNSPAHHATIPEESLRKETLKAPHNRSRASSNTSVSSRKSTRSQGSVVKFRISNKVDVCDPDSGQGDCDSPSTERKEQVVDEKLNKKKQGNGKVTMIETHIGADTQRVL